jgi:flagellar protein FliS
MTYSKILGQYKRVGVETAGRLDLVVMCYEKALEMLRHAKKHYEEHQFEEKAKKLQKALEIINTLQSCLDFEKGGAIAKNLDGIYIYLTRRLLEGDIKRDLTVFDEAIRILGDLGDAWQSIASGGQNKFEKIAIPDRSETNVSQIAA